MFRKLYQLCRSISIHNFFTILHIELYFNFWQSVVEKDLGLLIRMLNINNSYNFYYSNKKEINDDPQKKFCDLLLKWCQNDILWQTLRLYLSSQYILRVVILLQVVYICISARDFTSKNYHRPVKMTLKAFEWVKSIKFKPNICIA